MASENRPEIYSTRPPPNESLAQFFEEHRTLVAHLRQFDPLEIIPIIGGLLTHPGWQASTLRLEVLQHLALACAQGKKKPKTADLKAWLTDLGAGHAGELEDPTEHVFVSRVLLPDRDCLIFNGIFDAPAFHLQNFIKVLAAMPGEKPFGVFLRAARALLTLSDAVAVRAGLTVCQVGGMTPLKEVPNKLLRNLNALARRVIFTADDLAALGITFDDLKHFVFDPDLGERLRSEPMNCTTLERFPLIWTDEGLHLALPTSVSIAIRRMIVESAVSANASHALYSLYVRELAGTFLNAPFLMHAEPCPTPRPEGTRPFVTDFVWSFDEGRILHFCFLVDDFDAYEQTGTFGVHPEAKRTQPTINASLDHVQNQFTGRPDFKQGVTLLVVCAWGRPVGIAYDPPTDSRWRIEPIPGDDLHALSWDPNFSPLQLWRALDILELLRKNGVELLNSSGLLNLLAWCEHWSGDFIGRRDLPGDLAVDTPLAVQIPQNALLWIRKRAVESWDHHHARTWDGCTLEVRRETPGWSSGEIRPEALYVSTHDLDNQRLLAVFETPQRGWWAWVETPNMDDPSAHYRLWHAAAMWLSRAVPILENALPALPPESLAWALRFEDPAYGRSDDLVSDENQLRAMIGVSVQENVVRVTVAEGFLASFSNPVNIGERLLVESLVIGSLRLCGADAHAESSNVLMKQIVPDEWARNLHVFTGPYFRDFFLSALSQAPTLATQADEAVVRIGLGWRVRDRSEGAVIEGASACCFYLARVIDSLWDEIAGMLRTFQRDRLLVKLLANYEAAKIESDKWSRSSRSILSLSENKGQAAGISARRVADIGNGLFSSRVLIEMSMCECPVDRGSAAGHLDIARLMGYVLRMSYLGGMSEAIYYGVERAQIQITPLGDVQIDSDFSDRIANPFGASLMMRGFFQGVSAYESLYEHRNIEFSAREAFDVRFWEAWEEHFGFSVDDLRVFMDGLETEGIKRQAVTFTSTVAEMCRFEDIENLPAGVVQKIVDALVLWPRATWASTPEGFSPKDWYPWRYRRRLSVLARPILQIGGAESGYLLAPGLVRDGGAKLVDYCYMGGFEAKTFPAGRLRSWVGAAENQRGHEFNGLVARRLSELGWSCKANVRLTEILSAKLDRDYGDVDVLAWRGRRVLVIECKDLRMAMTVGDIARQLHDFREDFTSSGKPDQLKKHLLRMDVLMSRPDGVTRYVGTKERRIELEAVLVFSDLVPLHFSGIASSHSVHLVLFEQLETL